jgi:ubiquinone/menaquinone biosynthesis C-methylase UbiE
MDEEYWDRLAADYDEEVFSSLDSDDRGLIRSALDGLASRRKTALDLGCGVGKYVGALSERFGKVIAVDHSTELLEIARRRHADPENVEFRKVDASRGRSLRGGQADVVICANVLIMADEDLRRGILETARRSMRPTGSLLLVLPSLESALLVQRRLAEWYRREGAVDPEACAEREGIRPSRRSCSELLQGLVRIDGVPTRHYLGEEIAPMLSKVGLEPTRLEKIRYPWRTEFNDAPRWMRDPLPWDWLTVARRRGARR